MSRLTTHALDSAPDSSRPFLEAAKAKNGYVPNLLGVLANAPAAIEAYVKVTEINGRSSFSLAERETVQITAAVNHGCAFCVAGHTAICYRQGHLDPGLVNALRSQSTLDDPKLEALAAFTREVIRTRGNVDDETLRVFYASGYGQQQALEVVLGVSLATLCNFANSLGRTELNAELDAYRWDGV
jgi:AhpD family alkylhydroperoxidase